MPGLEVRAGCAGYGDLQVLFGVDLSIRPGAVTAVLGPNGAGKSTLLNAIAGILPFWSGSEWLGDRDVTRAAVPHRVRAGITLVPQGRELFGPMTVRENLELGAFQCRLSRRLMQERIARTLQLFPDLVVRLERRAEELSGGQQQMVAIGRALMSEPAFLLIDEPSQGLGPIVVEAVLDSLRVLAREGMGVALAEQDGSAGLRVADHCYVMRSGSVVWSGSAASAASGGVLRELYFGPRD
ncbi:MAG TPA: ABC transporter ATP-binding protein [Candidatus Dormibacteraeota bacterium]|nr:ABC transporter ATP-binding protein [Candidatus Dormibacteraeota bacterium]